MPSANHNVELHLRYTNRDSSLSPILALLGGASVTRYGWRYTQLELMLLVLQRLSQAKDEAILSHLSPRLRGPKTKTKTKTQESQDQDQDQDQDFNTWVSRRLETKTQVSRTTSLKKL